MKKFIFAISLFTFSFACQANTSSSKPDAPVEVNEGDETGADSDSTRPPPVVAPVVGDNNQPEPPAPTTPAGTTPEGATPVATTPAVTPTPAAEQVYLLCQIRKSDDRLDYEADLSEFEWNSMKFDIEATKHEGYLCYQAAGSNIDTLKKECELVGQRLRAVENNFPVKAFPIQAKKEDRCVRKDFSAPGSSSCNCSKLLNGVSYRAVGYALFGYARVNTCETAFDFCKAGGF